MSRPTALSTPQPSLGGPLLALQQRLAHEFSQPKLLQQALTHRSFSVDHNERLEFLGDSVLNLAVAGLLYERLAELPEGDLSIINDQFFNYLNQEIFWVNILNYQLLNPLRLNKTFNQNFFGQISFWDFNCIQILNFYKIVNKILKLFYLYFYI